MHLRLERVNDEKVQGVNIKAGGSTEPWRTLGAYVIRKRVAERAIPDEITGFVKATPDSQRRIKTSSESLDSSGGQYG